MSAEGKNLPAADQATLLLLQPRGLGAVLIWSIELVELALEGLGRPRYARTKDRFIHLRNWGFNSIREVEWTHEDLRFGSQAELTS